MWGPEIQRRTVLVSDQPHSVAAVTQCTLGRQQLQQQQHHRQQQQQQQLHTRTKTLTYRFDFNHTSFIRKKLYFTYFIWPISDQNFRVSKFRFYILYCVHWIPVNGIGDDKEESTVSVETGFFRMIFTAVESYKIVQCHRKMTSGSMLDYKGDGNVDTTMTKVSR